MFDFIQAIITCVETRQIFSELNIFCSKGSVSQYSCIKAKDQHMRLNISLSQCLAYLKVNFRQNNFLKIYINFTLNVWVIFP